MLILGWHGNPQSFESQDAATFQYHDAAAVLLHDGVAVAAIEEERLNRIKHSSCFPARSIRFCLAQMGASLHDVDAIATDMAEEFCDFVVVRDAADDVRRPFLTGREVVARAFEREFKIDVRSKLHFCRHHLAHLHSAIVPSGFTEGLALCLDGDGDGASGLIATFRKRDHQVLRHLPEALSLGNFYLQSLFFLGYQRFDEYKAMGLAPYGNPSVYDPLFKRMYSLQPEGRFDLVPRSQCLLLMREAGLTLAARRKGEPFTQAHKDFAAALQITLERIVEHIVTHFHTATGAKQLCISGGVGHNCTLNGKLLRSGLFEQIYIQPASHDAGNALGAALAVARDVRDPIRSECLPHVFLGPGLGSADEIAARLTAWQPWVRLEKLTDAPRMGAQLIAAGEVIAWVQGRSEFGPRALGNRSILADPRPGQNKLIINEMIKKREEYRPFAPAVLEERLRDYFEVPVGTRAVPYMVTVLPVKAHVRGLLGATTHVDGSARVQSVSRRTNPLFHSLIQEFGRLTGVPVLLNTSFNNNAEPIVDSVDDAVVTFLTTGIQALIIEDWLIRKPGQEELIEALADLIPTLPPGRKMTCRSAVPANAELFIEGTSQYSSGAPLRVSEEVFRLLLTDTRDSIRGRCQRAGCEPMLSRICNELWDLWASRAVRLSPTG